MDIHNYKRRLERTVENLNCSKISEGNKKLLMQFHNNCFTESLSLSKIERYLYDLHHFAEMVGKPLLEATKDEIKAIVATIEKKEWSPHTKHAFKVAIRKFYKSIEGPEEKGVYPERIRWLHSNVKNNQLKSSENLITELEIRKIAENSNYALGILNDFNKVLVTDKDKTIKNIKNLGKAGWRIKPESRVGYQYLTILCLTYHAYLEKLKNILLAFIDWDKIVSDPSKIYGIGKILEQLKKHIPNNPYLNYFNSGDRNAIAHFTFFWENGKIYLCDGLFDKSPESKTTAEFMIEVKRVNVLVEGLQLVYRDYLGLPEVKTFVD